MTIKIGHGDATDSAAKASSLYFHLNSVGSSFTSLTLRKLELPEAKEAAARLRWMWRCHRGVS